MRIDNPSTTQLAELLGQRCHWMPPSRKGVALNDIGFLCDIKDARNSFGRAEVLVVPLEGFGKRWVWLEHCEMLGKDNEDAD